MGLFVVGSILVTVPLGPLETQIEPKPAATSRGDDSGISITNLPADGVPATLVEGWPHAVIEKVTARLEMRVFIVGRRTPEGYSPVARGQSRDSRFDDIDYLTSVAASLDLS